MKTRNRSFVKFENGSTFTQNNGLNWTLTRGFYVQMGGFLLYNKETSPRVLCFEQLLVLIQPGLVDRPNVTEDDVRDRSNGDFLTGSLVVAHSLSSPRETMALQEDRRPRESSQSAQIFRDTRQSKVGGECPSIVDNQNVFLK